MAHVRFLFSFFIFRDFFLYCVCSIVREYLLNNHVTPLAPATEIVFFKERSSLFYYSSTHGLFSIKKSLTAIEMCSLYQRKKNRSIRSSISRG
jgi:hypothetical protein